MGHSFGAFEEAQKNSGALPSVTIKDWTTITHLIDAMVRKELVSPVPKMQTTGVGAVSAQGIAV